MKTEKKNCKTGTGKTAAKKTKENENIKTKETVSMTATTYLPYDTEATKYMFMKRPGTFSLIHFVGEQVSLEIAGILGRSITLPEAEHLVSLDGDPTTCASEDVEFQPVKYLPFVPKGLGKRIANGESLVDIRLPLGGAYYLTKDDKAIAYSGSVFRYDARRQRYEWANGSPLVIIADETGKRYGQRQWGVPFEEVDNILKAKNAATDRRQRISKMVENIAPMRRRPDLGHMSDAFEHAHIGGRNGKPKREYDRAEVKRAEQQEETATE